MPGRDVAVLGADADQLAQERQKLLIGAVVDVARQRVDELLRPAIGQAARQVSRRSTQARCRFPANLLAACSIDTTRSVRGAPS